MAKADMFLDMMFHSADQMHLWHLQTKSYAQHKALDGYYTDARGSLDDISEKLMGYKGARLKATGKMPLFEFKGTEQIMSHLDAVEKFMSEMNKELLASDKNATHIVNAVDAFREVIAKTKYLLTLS